MFCWLPNASGISDTSPDIAARVRPSNNHVGVEEEGRTKILRGGAARFSFATGQRT